MNNNIINKSNHPVEVKIIKLRMWTLRDEIKHAVELCLKEMDNQKAIQKVNDDYKPQDDSKPAFERKVPEKYITKGHFILSDLNMESILMFSCDKFTPGQNIALELDIPEKLTLSAQVAQVHYIGDQSKVLRPDKPLYRISAKLLYTFKDEISKLRNFLSSVEPDIPVDITKKAPKEDLSVAQDEEEDLGL